MAKLCRCSSEDPERRHNDYRGILRGGQNHAQATASEARSVDGSVYVDPTNLHHHRADGEWGTA